MLNNNIITIDGPASSGKGTVARLLAKKLNFDYLDSGAIYRAVAYLADIHNLIEDAKIDISQLLILIKNNFVLKFDSSGLVYLNDEEVSSKLRLEKIGNLASNIAKDKQIRESLLDYQHFFAKNAAIGLVTDGRDMGSVVFKNAKLKIFLTASIESRLERRLKQLQENSKSGIIAPILHDVIRRDILARDRQDSLRDTAPLGYDSSYHFLDNTDLTIDETVLYIIDLYHTIN